MSIEYSQNQSNKSKSFNNDNIFHDESKYTKYVNSANIKQGQLVNPTGDKSQRNSTTLVASINEEHTESVVFERIVPSAVKKMWVKAEESGSGYSVDQDHLEHQEKTLTSPLDKQEKNLSFQYGDVLLSRDVTKEEKANKKTGRIKRSDSISEVSEISQAKGKWGVDLKHIDDSDKLPFGFPKLKRVTSGNSQRPKSSLIDENFSVTSNLSSKHRSRSVDALNQIDGESNFSEDYPSELSVQQRRKNFFENNLSKSSVIKPPEFDKYAYLQAKRPNMKNVGNVDLRGGMTNSKIFYQPHHKNSLDLDSTFGLNNFATKTQHKGSNLSLQELLKLDQERLEGHIVKANQSDSNNNQKNDAINKHKVKSEEFNQYTQHKPSVEKDNNSSVSLIHKREQESISNGISSGECPKIVKKIQASEPIVKKSEIKEYLFSVETKAENAGLFVKNKTELSKQISNNELQQLGPPRTTETYIVNTSIGGSIKDDIIAKENTQLDIDLKSEKQSKQLRDQCQQPSQQQPLLLQQQSPAQPQNQQQKQQLPQQVQQQQQPPPPPQKQQSPLQQLQPPPKKQPSLQKQSLSQKQPLTQNQQHQQQPLKQKQKSQQLPHQQQQQQQKKQQPQQQKQQPQQQKQQPQQQKQQPQQSEESKVKYNKLGQVILTKEGSSINSTKVEAKCDSSANITKSTNTIASNQSSTSSPGGIRRRVGKLIIMTGEQRDQQLKEIELSKNSPPGAPHQISINKQVVNDHAKDTALNGFSLTFMSNEVADDDPDEVPLPVPKILFNSPVIGLRSILSPKDFKNKQKKLKNRVHFKDDKLAIVHSYPRESSYLDETDNSGKYAYAANAVQSERERMLIMHQETKDDTPADIIKPVMEGEHFNSHFEQEGGVAMLF